MMLSFNVFVHATNGDAALAITVKMLEIGAVFVPSLK